MKGVTKEASVGTRTTLEILDAQKELTDSESNLVNAQYQLIISSFELLKLCGILNFETIEKVKLIKACLKLKNKIILK